MIEESDLTKLADILLAAAATGPLGPETRPALFQVFEKLRQGLTKIAGSVGFRTLLARSLHLARAKFPALSALSVSQDGSLHWVPGLEDPQLAAQAGGALIAEFLELLAQFVGKPLVLKIIFDIWPELEARQDVSMEQE